MQYPLYVIGKRKDDTTAYLRRLFLEHITAGNGGAYFDFSGDITGLISHIPDDRNVVLFIPTDREYPIGFNPLRPASPRTATAIVDAFKSVWHYDSATPLLDLYLYTTIAALMDVPDATLLGIAYMLTDPAYRAKVIGYIRDPVLKTFWETFYETLPEKEQKQTTMSTLNKIFALITDPTIRNIIGQKRSTFILSDKDVLVASFPQELGVEKGSFLATLLLSFLPPMLTILDDGDRIGSRAVLGAVNSAPVAFSHQYLAQLTPALQETLIGTAQTLVAFRIGPTDADRLAPEFYLKPQGNYALTDLPPETYHLRTAYETKADQTLAPLDLLTFDVHKHINRSRHDHCRNRADVEKGIATFVDTAPKKRKTRR